MSPLVLAVRAVCEARADDLGLAPPLTVTPILNWGGFDNASFTVSDGARRRHVKVSQWSAPLKRFHRAAARLTERYRSPAVLGWLDVSEIGYAGLVFEAIDGETLREAPPAFLSDLGLLLSTMHADTTLAAMLGDEPQPCSATYRGIYQRRFTADLDIIDNAPPPFIVPATRDWMRSEALRLDALVADMPEFAEPANAPVHTDIWENNILVCPDKSWFLIDWDGLCIGDPAIDWAMTSNLRQAGPPKSWSDLGIVLSPDIEARVNLYRRAVLLDRVIDPLADWIEAGNHPRWQEQVRSANEAIHVASMATYRALY